MKTNKVDLSSLRALLENNDSRDKAVEALMDAMEATRTYYDGVLKKMVVEPDNKTRMAAAVMVLAYTDGRPIERQEVVSISVDSMTVLEERVRTSPALRRSLEQLLED